MNTRRTTLLGVAVVALTLLSPGRIAAADDLPDGSSDSKVLLIDIDGVRWDRLRQAQTPHLDSLAAKGSLAPSYLHGTDLARTDSGPGHANILTGVWPDKHQVRGNDFADNRLSQYPDVLTRLETAQPQLSTFSILDWQPINEHLIDAPDVKLRQSTEGGTTASDRRTTDTVASMLSREDPDVGYVYYHGPDAAGHEFGGSSAEYIESIERVDTLVGELVAAVAGRERSAEEDWLFLVTTDHGFSHDKHGGNGHRTRQAWTLASGGDIPVGGTRQARQVDLVPTIFSHLAIPVEDSWGLDGTAIGAPLNDPFDTVAGELSGVVDEPAKPDGLLGWTKTLPSGWSIDERTPNSGAAEYRGWSLMTGQFWATSQSDQGRESFVRGQEVIAVADADEWNDVGDPAKTGDRLDSTLLSPWLEVAPGDSVTVEYLSHYRHAARDGDPQKAELVVLYDDGSRQVLDSRDAADGDRFDVSVPESATTTVPAGVNEARIGWRLYEAANNFYWAIDDPRIVVS